MKGLFILFCVFHFSAELNAQVLSGHFRYSAEINPLDSTDANLQAATMFRSSKIDIYFCPYAYKVVVSSGKFGITTNVVNTSTHKHMFLGENNKYKIGSTASLDSLPDNMDLIDSTASVNVFRDSTRTILGYDCYFVELFENNIRSWYWCTDDFKIDFQGKSVVSSKLPGFPLQINQENMGFIFKYTASNFESISGKLEELFSTEIPDGYEEIKMN